MKKSLLTFAEGFTSTRSQNNNLQKALLLNEYNRLIENLMMKITEKNIPFYEAFKITHRFF